jgi:hypothetical protein
MHFYQNRKLTSLYRIADGRVSITEVIFGYFLQNFYPHVVTSTYFKIVTLSHPLETFAPQMFAHS